jgi:hypothetical protein
VTPGPRLWKRGKANNLSPSLHLLNPQLEKVGILTLGIRKDVESTVLFDFRQNFPIYSFIAFTKNINKFNGLFNGLDVKNSLNV